MSKLYRDNRLVGAANMVGRLSLIITVAILVPRLCGQTPSVNPRQFTSVSPTQKFVRSGWADDESMLAKAIAVRADKIEKKTGFRFDENWTPRVTLEWSLGRDLGGTNGKYEPETQTIHLSIRVVYEFKTRHQPAANSVNVDTAVEDEELSELLDHELGHQLMDQIGRRNGLAPWFTEERFNSSSNEEKIGLDILSEGTALYFQRANFPRDDSDLSTALFPATLEDQRFYSYRMIAYDGGYWIVRDVLAKYGEHGLLWLMRNPFVAGDDMRSAAVAYRGQAMRELSNE